MATVPNRHDTKARVPILLAVSTVHGTALGGVGTMTMANPVREGNVKVKVKAKRAQAGGTEDPGAGASPMPKV